MNSTLWREDGVHSMLSRFDGRAQEDVTLMCGEFLWVDGPNTTPGRLDASATPGVIELSRVASGLADQVAGMVFLGERPGWLEFGALALVLASLATVVIPVRK